MPPRLMHKKSRSGCKNCKSRKVKCDEARPSCGACTRHRLKCEYAVPAQSLPSSTAIESTHSTAESHPVNHLSSPPISSHSPAPSSINTGAALTESNDGSLPATNERRLLELRLMHHYMQSLHEIFPGSHNAAMVEVWRDKVPVLAVSHPFLLHALFAVATLHLIIKKERALEASLEIPANDLGLESMRRARVRYFNLAINGQRMAIADLNKRNADAACIATILISNQGFILNPELDTDETNYAPPVQWILLARSIGTVFEACRGMLEPDSAIDSIIQSGRSVVLEKTSAGEDDTFFDVLMDYHPNSEIADQKTYQSTLRLLSTIRRGCEAGEPSTHLSQRFSSFPHLLPSAFTGLVQQQRPRALAILACFFAMTKEVETLWWFQGAAAKHVKGLKKLVSADWTWAFYWIEDFAYTQDAGKRRRLLSKAGMTAP